MGEGKTIFSGATQVVIFYYTNTINRKIQIKANVDYLKVETIIRWTPLLGSHCQVGLNSTLSVTETSSRAALRPFALSQ